MREEENKKKKLLIFFAIIAAIVIACSGIVILKSVRNHNTGPLYTYIDYNDGTTKAIDYYIDDEGHAYNYSGKEKVYVLLSPDIIERNKAGEVTVDSRDLANTKAGSTEPSESVSN